MAVSPDRSKQSAPTPVLSGTVRLARFLAACGLGSRRKCEEIIRNGQVTVNGQVVESPALNVDTRLDCICFGGQLLRIWSPCYLMLNKPPGYTCSASDSHAKRLVFQLLPTDRGRLFTVGRLDRDSEGLLIATNDGEFAQRLAHPRHAMAKVYRVNVSGDVSPADITAMTDGVIDQGERLRAESVEVKGSSRGVTELEMVLRQGKKREIRRLCARVGLRVKRLRRLSIGGVKLGELKEGQWRELTPEEVAWLQR